MIVVACPCGAQFRAPDEFAGRRARCKSCGQTLTVSAASAAGTDAAPPPAPPTSAATAMPSPPAPISPTKTAEAPSATPGVLDLSVFDAALAHLDDDEVAPAPAAPAQTRPAAQQPAAPPRPTTPGSAPAAATSASSQSASPPPLLPGRPPADGIPPDQRTTVTIVPSKKPGRLYLECACGGRLSVRETSFKKRATCPHCQKKFIVPKPPHLSDADACDLPVLEVADNLSALADAGGAADANDLARELAGLAPPPAARAPHPAAPTGKPPSSRAPAAAPVSQAAARVKPAAIAPRSSGGSAARTGGPAASPPPRPVPIPSASGTIEIEASGDSLLGLAEDDAAPSESIHVFEQKLTATPMDGPICPCCEKQLARNARFCVECGIDAKTGRSIVLRQETSLDAAVLAADRFVPTVSKVVWFGFCPVASDAYGKHQPTAAKVLVGALAIAGLCLYLGAATESIAARSVKQLLLWPKHRDLTYEEIALARDEAPELGDVRALDEAAYELLEQRLAAAESAESTLNETTDSAADSSAASETLDGSTASSNVADAGAADGNDSAFSSTRIEEEVPSKEDYVAAHAQLAPANRLIGAYSVSQLLTYCFVPDGLGGLLIDALFMWVFLSAINAVAGHLTTVLLFLGLAVVAGLAHLWALPPDLPLPLSGPNGAIMGLAGAYLVLFPVQRAQVAIWGRWPCLLFYLTYKLITLSGYWLVLIYIAIDLILLAVFGGRLFALQAGNIVGFGAGLLVALLLVIARRVNARGGDILSVILGKHAWPLVGKPNRATT